VTGDRYPVLERAFRREESIERSRFITSIAPAESEAEATRFIGGIREEFPDANHHCYAYLIGPPGTSAGVGMSDDGEPHGTAGRPMLNMLTHGGVGDVVAVVTRYFGGRKLGRGGLARAYGGGVQAALVDAPKAERVEWVHLELSFAYAEAKSVRRLYPMHEAESLEERFDASVTDRVRIPSSREEGFRDGFIDLLRGKGTIERVSVPPSQS